VAARCRYLERAFGRGLAPHIGEVGLVVPRLGHESGDVHFTSGDWMPAAQVGADFEERVGSAYVEPLDHRSFGNIGVGQEDTPVTGGARRQRH
jgi:hypothetical protein